MLQCPKCHAMMRTFNRGGVHIEQCEGCRGVFLDYGELEALSRMESQWAPPPPYGGPVAPPAWGTPHHSYGRSPYKSFAKLLFSS